MDLKEFHRRKNEFRSQWQISNILNLKLGILDIHDVFGHFNKKDPMKNPYIYPFAFHFSKCFINVASCLNDECDVLRNGAQGGY